MKAVVCPRYGSTDVLEMRDVALPTLKETDVLVRVYAAAVNSADLDYLKGTTLTRLGGLFRPMYEILGSDIAGCVEAVGSAVTQFKPGDEVFADLSECGFGAFAEFAAVPEHALVLKPRALTFEQAAAVPTAAIIALQGLRRLEGRPGQRVLLNGAGGGVGTFAVQMAKGCGAHVTAVDKAAKADLLRAIGADDVVDYTREDITRRSAQYDLILDVVAYRSIFDYRRILAPEGAYLVIGGSVFAILQAAFSGSRSSSQGQAMTLLAVHPTAKDLTEVKEMIDAGRLKPIIDSTYPFHQTAEALRRLESGLARGKVVITM